LILVLGLLCFSALAVHKQPHKDVLTKTFKELRNLPRNDAEISKLIDGALKKLPQGKLAFTIRSLETISSELARKATVKGPSRDDLRDIFETFDGAFGSTELDGMLTKEEAFAATAQVINSILKELDRKIGESKVLGPNKK